MQTNYTRHGKRRPLGGLIIGIALAFGAGVLVTNFAPGNMWLEIPVVGMVAAAMLLLTSFAFKNVKWGLMVTVWIVGALVLKRMQIWDWWVAGLWLVVVGLISLVN
jgi:hypothetical protein